ncbi:MAG: ubiquinol-cytochrome c reductase iron-sulfur subunit [Deltaproteobacteria bacterium]|nr:ubiquinol-cytochrome c reductase iron-sulfur subunit [Deltaproteobacteria bacterium]MBW2171634.1 ubiquinol-cytochrome c reductase iron-sulfur subunit [Deltaproteobacteria bacterium]MBW2259656.1 ubiquinol-cytochrome c reductase iron-sulfur subunit [Deltaproteobacteria bacterium]
MKNRPKRETTDQGEVTRRSFLTWLWVGLGIVALMEFTSLVVAYLRGGKPRQEKGTGEAIVEAGPAEKFAVNSVTAFVRGRFYLCRLEDGGFLAVSRKCTHLGCTVPWKDKEKKFACPCHGSAFDIRGEVISPPAPRALDIYPVAIENNIVKVNTGRPVKRSEFKQEQVVYPT